VIAKGVPLNQMKIGLMVIVVSGLLGLATYYYKLLDSETSDPETIDFKQVSAEMNQQLPRQFNDDFIDLTSFENGVFTFNIRTPKDQDAFADGFEALRGSTLKQLCDPQGPFRGLLEHEQLQIIFDYKDMDQTALGKFAFNKNDCVE
jgi:hypothetical protein